MTDIQKVILIALGLLLALCVVVGLTLRHAIGGFLENVAREKEESDEAAEPGVEPSARQENKS